MGEESTRPPKRRKLDELDPQSEDSSNGTKRKKFQEGPDEVHKGDVVASGDAGGSGSASKLTKKDKNMSRSEYRRKGKGRRRGTRNNDTEVESTQGSEPKIPRLPKRQCALLIGFCGAGYNGMQM